MQSRTGMGKHSQQAAAAGISRMGTDRVRMPHQLISILLCFVLTMISLILFLPGTSIALLLTDEEKNWIKQNPDKLVLWYNTDFPPMEFASESGAFIGMGADIIGLIEEQLGATFIKQASNDWNQHLSALKSGVCAVAPTIVDTAERQQYAGFTPSYASSPVVIITATAMQGTLTLSDIDGLRVAVVSGYATEEYLRNVKETQFDLIPMPDVARALRATSFGQVDAYVENLAVAAYYIQKEGIPNLKVAGDTPYRFSWCIGVSRQYPLLVSAMTKALAAVPVPLVEAARNQWISPDISPKWSHETVHRMAVVGLFMVLLISGLLVISYMLRRRLREKIISLESARMQIAEQMEFMQLAMEVTQAGLWDSMPAERAIFFSRQWFGMLGYDRDGEKMSYGGIKQFIHPEDFPLISRKFEAYTLSDGQAFHEIEFRLKKADGTWVWVLSKGRAVAWSDTGSVSRIIGLDVNIQTIKDAQEEMAQSEAKFRAIFDNAPYSIVINDYASGRILDANPAFFTSTGIKDLKDLAQLPSTGFSNMGQDEAGRVMDQLGETGKIPSYEIESVRADGSRRHLVFSSTLMECAGQKQILSIVLDNTERKKAEKALKASEARFRQLFMSAPVPLVLLSVDGKFSAINQAMIHTFGYTLEEIPDLDHWWVLAYRDPEYRMQVKSAWEKDVRCAFDENTPVKAHEYYVTCKNGKVLRVLFNTSVSSRMIIVSLYEITELREKEAALQETMERLRATLDATNDGILVVDNALKVIQANRQFFNMWHIPQDFPGIDDDVALRRFVKGQLQDPDGFMALINDRYANRRHETFEIRFMDGRVFECYSAAMVIAGEETGRVWDFRDITARKIAEEAIDLERKKLQSVFWAMNDIVLILDVSGQLVEVVPTQTDFLYRSPEEMLGKTLDEIFPPEKTAAFMDAIRLVISRNESVRLDYELDIGDRSLWFTASISPMPPDRVVWVARDTTSRKLAEARLRQSEEKFSKIFAMTPSIVGISRMEDGHLIDVNRGFEEMTGWKRDEVVGLTATDIGFWAEPTSRPDMVRELKAGHDLLNREVHFRRKDGQVRMGLYSARSISLSGELSILSSVQDITEIKKIAADRQKLQTQLMQTQKMEAIGALAGGIAHDFNNILSALMGFTDLARMKVRDDDTILNYLNSISSASLRARDLVRHILTFSRKSDVTMQPISMDPIIKETLKFIRASLPSNIQIQQDLKIKQAKILGDATQIHQILMNLFTNAGHAMRDKGGQLDVTLDRVFIDPADAVHFNHIQPGNYFSLIISDTGKGIPPAIIDRIFEPFFTTKKREEGTGMGLSTVYGILKDMGGSISVYSEENIGSTFKILIPELAPDGQMETSQETDLIPGKGNILIIDDEQAIVESNQGILTYLGYSVTGTTDCLQALERIANAPDYFDLVLTDMTMPEMNGLDLARRIQSINSRVPILLCTGFSHRLTKQMWQSAGVFDLLMKPLIAGELSRAVDHALKSCSGRKEPGSQSAP